MNNKVTKFVVSHGPIVVGAVLVVLNYLIDNGSLVLSGHTAGLLNAVLAATGLGSLHYNQRKAS